jgi:hypothetical protein
MLNKSSFIGYMNEETSSYSEIKYLASQSLGPLRIRKGRAGNMTE